MQAPVDLFRLELPKSARCTRGNAALYSRFSSRLDRSEIEWSPLPCPSGPRVCTPARTRSNSRRMRIAVVNRRLRATRALVPGTIPECAVSFPCPIYLRASKARGDRAQKKNPRDSFSELVATVYAGKIDS